ncbi:hypothetical protein [Alkaliphilus oremlandii]|uniref:Uncharacterized protein n=1 Tax=Alkaliphilus oremlandii (strain OhILAs) TaxID=350688 RepID=A8MF96_ALKOO|nr:hypothetical protein [Alkaliphilus oremlandii]ABW18765.1 conserved hypothetical protein [Alkaliphilus oremlandii OhILAs]
MAKVISLNEYIVQKKKRSYSSRSLTHPIWFHEISDGIKSLALRDKDVIYNNIKYNYYDEYLYFVNRNHMALEDYTFEDYLKDTINLNEPFDIVHGVEFSKGYDLNRLSENDWENIADIIVRISITTILFQENFVLEPNQLADEYDWDSIGFDYNL